MDSIDYNTRHGNFILAQQYAQQYAQHVHISAMQGVTNTQIRAQTDYRDFSSWTTSEIEIKELSFREVLQMETNKWLKGVKIEINF